MLDPLTALGAVANVAQFIEFAIKISSKSRHIYNSASGNPVEFEDLHKVNDDLSKISNKLRESFASATRSTCLTEDEHALCELCKSCVDVSEELTAALKKIEYHGKRGKIRSFRQALKSVWSKEDIGQLERRVSLYKDELNLRIIVGLRSTIDFRAVQQTEGFASIAEEIKATIQSLDCVKNEIRDGFGRQEHITTDFHQHTDTIVVAEGEQRKSEHIELSSQVSALGQQSSDQSQHQLDAQAITKMAVDLSLERNLVEHERTRDEMNRLKQQAEQQVEVLTEEIRLLKIELEASVKTIVASIGTASAREAARLKESSNAKFNLWVAKELILEKLKAFIALFRFNFAAEMWTSKTAEVRSWKLMPYPKFGSSATDEVPAPIDTERTMAYLQVDICYPVAARNVPMVKMCLDQGVDVNKRLPDGSTVLLKAIEAAYEFTTYDSISTCLVMLRDARKVVQLLIEYGADPSKEDVLNREPRLVSSGRPEIIPERRIHQLFLDKTQLDWMISQLLEAVPSPDLYNFLSLTDAVWAGDLKTVEESLLNMPELRGLMERRNSSPLGIAVFRGDDSMVELLLKIGFSPDARDPICSTPLAIAVSCRLEKMVRILMGHGASLEVLDPILHLTPLQYVAREGLHRICQVLLERETNPKKPEGNHLLDKPLFLAIKHCQINVVGMLLDKGACPLLDMNDFLPKEYVYQRRVRLTPREYIESESSAISPVDAQRLLQILAPFEAQEKDGLHTLQEARKWRAERADIDSKSTAVVIPPVKPVGAPVDHGAKDKDMKHMVKKSALDDLREMIH